MSYFLVTKILCIIGGGLSTGAAVRAYKNEDYFYSGFLLFTAIANLVIIGKY